MQKLNETRQKSVVVESSSFWKKVLNRLKISLIRKVKRHRLQVARGKILPSEWSSDLSRPSVCFFAAQYSSWPRSLLFNSKNSSTSAVFMRRGIEFFTIRKKKSSRKNFIRKNLLHWEIIPTNLTCRILLVLFIWNFSFVQRQTMKLETKCSEIGRWNCPWYTTGVATKTFTEWSSESSISYTEARRYCNRTTDYCAV